MVLLKTMITSRLLTLTSKYNGITQNYVTKNFNHVDFCKCRIDFALSASRTNKIIARLKAHSSEPTKLALILKVTPFKSTLLADRPNVLEFSIVLDNCSSN